MLLYRYSLDGFRPKRQDHLYEAKFKLEEMLENIDGYTEWQQRLIRNYDKPCPQFGFFGVFAFLKEPTPTQIEFYLNHVSDKHKRRLKLHVKEFPGDTVVYIDDGIVNTPSNRTTLGKLKNRKSVLTVYVPRKGNQL